MVAAGKPCALLKTLRRWSLHDVKRDQTVEALEQAHQRIVDGAKVLDDVEEYLCHGLTLGVATWSAKGHEQLAGL